MPDALQIATFVADVTPPIGHPLCGGWIEPVREIADPQHALGVLVRDGDSTYVLCAVDWCELRNRDHDTWRSAVAEAACTTADRVAVQCVHPHNAILCDGSAQELTQAFAEVPDLADQAFVDSAAARVATSVRKANAHYQPLTHMTLGAARVERVASNRRIMGEVGRVRAVRWSSCSDPDLQAEPEGLIDPLIRTIGLWNGERKVAALHYYATHPMSYYGDGVVTADFAGLARRLAESDGARHLYFTGCAGNVAAGKYNDGSVAMRSDLARRMHDAMVRSEVSADRVPLQTIAWDVERVTLPTRNDRTAEELDRTISDPEQSAHTRQNAALVRAYQQRAEAGHALELSCLRLGERAAILHLPGEPCIEYQLYAQNLWQNGLVAVAGYGDGGTGYIVLERHYAEGGYEPTASSLAPEAEWPLKKAIARLLMDPSG